MKNVVKNFKKYVIKFCDFIKEKVLVKSNIYLILLAFPFTLLDVVTRILGRKINFFKVYNPIPNLFTLSWIILMLGICLSFCKKKRKIIYSCFIALSVLIFLVNNIYYSVTNTFFDFCLIEMASEGSSYMIDALVNANKIIYIVTVFVLIYTFFVIKYMPYGKENNKLIRFRCLFIFILLQVIIPCLLGKANSNLSWNTWNNPRNIYMSFNDNNKSMSIAGIYEYTFRNFYVTYFRAKKSDNNEEKEFLDLVYNEEEKDNSNYYTSIFKNKNVIFLQLEGIDNWLLNETDTPTLYGMLNNSIVFNNHYSYYNGGGSTFNSEFAVNTGFLTPISYTQNAYTFNKNTFDYTLAKLFKNEGYSINAFHMNTSEFYSRGTNYKNWGYDNYYGLKDLGTYKDNSYELDRELILNESFNKLIVNAENKFLDYIITYSNHTPFSTEKGVCKALVYEDVTKDLDDEDIKNKNYTIPTLDEEGCARRQAKETDYMVSLLLDLLEEKDVIDDTVIICFTDHYLYTLNDSTILDKYKDTSNNLINHTSFFIWSNNTSRVDVNSVTSQLNILPTTLNLFGIKYNSNYYIGSDALSPSYDGYVFFSDYSWYDGNVYVDGGVVTNNKYIDSDILEKKNEYISYMIKKNDLTLKYNYFKYLNSKDRI